MKKQHISTMQTEILIRALGVKEFESLFEQYRNSYKREKRNTPPNPNQIRIASLVKKVGIRKTSEQLQIPIPKVCYAVSRVASYKYLFEEAK